MKKILIFILLIALLLITNQKGVTRQELERTMIQFNLTPLVSLLLIYDSLAPNAQGIEMLMKNIAEKRKGYFKVFMLDCNTDDESVLTEFAYCSDENRKLLPALVFSDPVLNSHEQKQINPLSSVKQYTGPLDDKGLFNFAVPLMKTYSVQLKNARDLRKFEQANPTVPKIIYYTDKESKQKIPPLYRALTANFRSTIAFAHVFANSQLAKDANVTSFPTFLLNNKQKIQPKHNITQFIAALDKIKGEPATIYIKQFESAKGKELTTQNLDQLVFKTPKYVMIHVIGQDGRDHPQWDNITRKFGKMFNFYETTTLKEALGVKQTPALVFFPKSLAKKSVQKTVFTSKDTFQDIYDQIDSMIEDFTVPLTNFIELQKLTAVHLQDDKFVAIYFHSKQIPLSYKVVSNDNRFHQDVAFFRMKDPEKQVLEQYQITKLPALIVMIVDRDAPQDPELTKKEKKEGKVGMSLRLAAYRGKYTYDDLFSFFKSFSKKLISQEYKSEPHHTQEDNNNKIGEIDKMKKLKTKCQQNCFILIINGNPQNEEKNKHALSLLQKQTYRFPTTNFGYIDGACHSQFIGGFEILEDQLPALIHIDAKFEKYSRMIGRLQPGSISNFFTRVKSKKAMYRGYDKLNFENKDCEFERDKIKKLAEESSKISQDQAAILQQLRQEQERKREEFEKAQKQDKRRKGKKGKRPRKQQQEQL